MFLRATRHCAAEDLEQRWSSHRSVVLWGLPRQIVIDQSLHTADVVFPRFPVADKEDSEKADAVEEDPFSAETSEELFD
jgi:hypothetical protein